MHLQQRLMPMFRNLKNLNHSRTTCAYFATSGKLCHEKLSRVMELVFGTINFWFPAIQSFVAFIGIHVPSLAFYKRRSRARSFVRNYMSFATLNSQKNSISPISPRMKWAWTKLPTENFNVRKNIISEKAKQIIPYRIAVFLVDKCRQTDVHAQEDCLPMTRSVVDMRYEWSDEWTPLNVRKKKTSRLEYLRRSPMTIFTLED